MTLNYQLIVSILNIQLCPGVRVLSYDHNIRIYLLLLSTQLQGLLRTIATSVPLNDVSNYWILTTYTCRTLTNKICRLKHLIAHLIYFSSLGFRALLVTLVCDTPNVQKWLYCGVRAFPGQLVYHIKRFCFIFFGRIYLRLVEIKLCFLDPLFFPLPTMSNSLALIQHVILPSWLWH